MKLLALVVLLIAISAAAYAERAPSSDGAPQVVTFTMDFPGQAVPWYELTVRADGSGEYKFSTGDAPVSEPIQFHVQPETAMRWMSLAAKCRGIHAPAEMKKVAFMGRKKLVISSGSGSQTLEFVSPKDAPLIDMTTAAQGLAATLEAGQQFAADLRFQRMRLDEDMRAWQDQLSSQQASNPEAISDVLQRISDDQEVLSRVRRGANSALSGAPSKSR